MINVTLDEGAKLPTRAFPSDAGIDLYAKTNMPPMTIMPHASEQFDTGVHMAIPYGYFGQLFSKSGLCVKNGVVSTAGTIDASYRGAIVVRLYNQSDKPYTVHGGDKLTQMVIMPCVLDCVQEVEKLDETERGYGGFGSTGI